MDRALRVFRWIALLPAIALVMAFMVVFFAAIPGENLDVTPWWVDVIAGPIGVWAVLIIAETIAPTHKRETVNVIAGLWIAPFAIHYILRAADIISEPIQMDLMLSLIHI